MALSAGSDPIATYELYPVYLVEMDHKHWRSFRDPGKGAGLVIAVWFVEMIIFSLLLINYSMRYTLNLYKEKQRLEAESIQAKYTALQSQLNPHFLFNSLNTLIAEIEYDPSTAVKFTQHLSEVYRYVLRQQQCQIVSLKEELDFLDSYIFLHQVRLGDCLSLERDLPDNVIDHQLPPLTLQLLAENVVKHNYIDDFNPMTIRVYTERTVDIYASAIHYDLKSLKRIR